MDGSCHLTADGLAQPGIILSWCKVGRDGVSPWDDGIQLVSSEPARWGDLPQHVPEIIRGFAPCQHNAA